MCGITGVIDLSKRAVESSLLLAMNKAIAHRGPDDEGYILIHQQEPAYSNFAGPSSPDKVQSSLPLLTPGTGCPEFHIGLGHRRFSIIDISEAGHQPFVDRAGTCCVVYNGEIYNYLELRDQLKAEGVVFETQSDTEVLLEAYKRWGTDCFSRLNGFWALAIYDFTKKRLLVSRDRIGKKPLYWTKAGGRIYFASEIKALLQIPEVYRRRRPNEEVIGRWLAYGRKDLDTCSCFEGIYSLPAASWAVVDERFPQNTVKFWSVPKGRLAEKDIPATEAAKTLRTILQDAVNLRLRADVPLSVELSGGMDSSALVALSAQASQAKIATYTVRFSDEGCNEEPFARSVARYYNTDHRVIESPTENFWSQIQAFTYLEEEPYHDPVLQTNQVIWSQMRSMGTKVSLNGAGGDENLAGYSTYMTPFQIENLTSGKLVTYFREGLRYSEGRTNIRAMWRPVARLGTEAVKRLLPDSWRTNERACDYYTGKAYRQPLLEPLTASEALHNQMSTTLMPYWLRSGDRGYMGIPMEVRAPFLDYRFIEFAFQLPVTYLIRDGWQKWILRKAMQGLLPDDVVWRRQKMGFPFPTERFFSEYAEIIETILQNSQNPYIDFSKLRVSDLNWKALSFVLWYELFFNENTELFKLIQNKARQLHPVKNYGYTSKFLESCDVSCVA